MVTQSSSSFWAAIDTGTPYPERARVMAPKKTYRLYGPYMRSINTIYMRSTGELINIVDMDDSHLLNAIGKLERDKGVERAHSYVTYRHLVAEAIYRGLANGDLKSSEWDNEENN